jgi:tetratricopeptide (TPR) repeat protein
MPFPRAQGKKILILHNRREGQKVRQERLHVFDGYADAEETLRSADSWAVLCDSIEANLGDSSQVDRVLLKKKLRTIIDRGPKQSRPDPLGKAAAELNETLQNLKQPLTPAQLKSLRTAEKELKELQRSIKEKLELLKTQNEEKKKMETYSTREGGNISTELLFEQGLAHYDRAEWDRARARFVQGIKADPKHVDLHVHAGLSELLENNLDMALARFDRAVELGRQEIDRFIAKNPDEHLKYENYKDWLDSQTCRLADECPELGTDACDDCDHHPRMEWIGLYSYHEHRPFFRAMTNKAVTLMRMKRYQAAIDTLLLCQSYDQLWGVSNMMGECHLCLGNPEEANQWYGEMLWPEAFYVKSLILVQLSKREEALRYLLTGVTHNWHIARMLKGDEKTEPIRYIGQALPKKLEASEFIYEHNHLFKSQTRFKAILRCILEDPEIEILLSELAEASKRRKQEREYRMPNNLWDIMNGNMNHQFLDQHVPRLLTRLEDKSSDYWTPEKNEILTVTVREIKQLNWLATLNNVPEKTLYLRPSHYSERVSAGDTVKILVTKSWHYKKRLFVSGEVVQ